MVLYSIICWLLFWVVLVVVFYFSLMRKKEPFSLPVFIGHAVNTFFLVVIGFALTHSNMTLLSKDPDSHFAREQSCEAVVKETAMVTSVSMATGTLGVILLLAAAPGMVPLAVIAGSLASIGGYGIGAVVASSFSPNCQAPDT